MKAVQDVFVNKNWCYKYIHILLCPFYLGICYKRHDFKKLLIIHTDFTVIIEYTT